MQLIFITNRVSDIVQTIPHFEFYFDFLTRITIFTPEECVSEIQTSLPKCEVIDENKLLSKKKYVYFNQLKSKHQRNHTKINYLLRSCLAESDFVDNEFIMADDDSRPLTPISIEFFKKNGVYNAYFMCTILQYISYISNINDTNYRNIPFYEIHYDMNDLFKKLNLPSLMYASHMPQIINKEIFKKSVIYFSDFSHTHTMDEWSTYFNYGSHFFSEKFNIKLYETMCWPHLNFEFTLPNNYSFELLYQNDTIVSTYSNGSIFSDISPAFSSDQDRKNAIKISRYKTVQDSTIFKTGIIPLYKISNSCESFRNKEYITCIGKPMEIATFGPYLNLKRGVYKCTLNIEKLSSDKFPVCYVDVTSQNGSNLILKPFPLLTKTKYLDNFKTNNIYSFNFELFSFEPGVEIRTYLNQFATPYQFKSIQIDHCN